MRVFRVTVALLLVLALAATASAAHKEKKARKAARPFRGVVVAVERDQGDDGGTITVRRHQGKRAVEKTFKIRDMKKVGLGKSKGRRQAKRHATASSGLKERQRVLVRVRDGAAEEVRVLRHGKVADRTGKVAAKPAKHAKAAKKPARRSA